MSKLLISAHRCGSEGDKSLENTLEALQRAVETDCDYIEFDVQRLGDGSLVLFHDDIIENKGETIHLSEMTYPDFTSKAEGNHILYTEALETISGLKKAHIDFKFISPNELYEHKETFEIEAARVASEYFQPEDMIITSLEDCSIKSLKSWAQKESPETLVGLSLGRGLEGRGLIEKIKTRESEIFANQRLTNCDSDIVVANQKLARLTLARLAEKRKNKLLVWTVNEKESMEYWLRDPRVWMITTDFPRAALKIRDT